MKKLLFTAFAIFAILSCSNGDKMPCATCEENSPTYCLYIKNGSLSCSAESSKNCKNYDGVYYGNDHTCDNYLRKQAYCLSNDGYYDCDYVRVVTCAEYGGMYYDNVAICDGQQRSSSSSTQSSSSVSSSSVSDFCNIINYKTVWIGNQLWMGKNFNCYVPGSKCYDNKEANCSRYGRLYSWAAAMGLESKYNSEEWGNDAKRKGICPDGWHIPNSEEWAILMDFVEWDIAKLKATSNWNDDDYGTGNGTDEKKFTALPGGYGYDGEYEELGATGYWWLATEPRSSDYSAYSWYIAYDGDYDLLENTKEYLLSVRCLKDN